MSGDPAAELVEEVDAAGRVLGVVTRAEVRRRRVRHRTVFVAVLDVPGDRLLVHRRAAWKDVWPDRWDLAFGGICAVGESAPAAAVRELAEEAGLTSPLAAIGVGTYDDHDVAEVATIFTTHTDDPPTCPDGEVTEVAWVAIGDLGAWVSEHPVCPDSVALVLPRVAPS